LLFLVNTLIEKLQCRLSTTGRTGYEPSATYVSDKLPHPQAVAYYEVLTVHSVVCW